MRAFILIVTLAACGGSSGGGGTPIDASTHDTSMHPEAGDPGSYDFECGGSTPCTLDKVCCTNPGPPVSFSCTAKSACSMPDQITCDGPDDCTGGQVCCGTSVPDGSGNFPQCGAQSLGTACTAANACNTDVQQNCDNASKVQLCHTNADCQVESNNDSCCTFSSGPATLSFCFDKTAGQIAGGTCQ